MNHLVIMAGGTGSRFWPLSTVEKPKQFIDVLGTGKTLIQLTADRFKRVCSPQQMWVVTSKAYIDLVREQLPEIPEEHILAEPCQRNTAACIAYAAWKIKMKDPDGNLIITPADHVILDSERFRNIVIDGLAITKESNRIVTIGITPHRPDTGYGYIKTGKQNAKEGCVEVKEFKEKPDKETAKLYLRAGGYYWNSGVFLWNVKTIERKIKEHCPALSEIFDTISPWFYTEAEQEKIDCYYPKCEKISIDKAVMEKTDHMYVMPGSFGWSDLGTWGSLYDYSEKDIAGNVVKGNTIRLIDSENCIVKTTQKKQCVIEGLSGYIVVDHQNALLICRKESEQSISKWSE